MEAGSLMVLEMECKMRAMLNLIIISNCEDEYATQPRHTYYKYIAVNTVCIYLWKNVKLFKIKLSSLFFL